MKTQYIIVTANSVVNIKLNTYGLCFGFFTMVLHVGLEMCMYVNQKYSCEYHSRTVSSAFAPATIVTGNPDFSEVRNIY